jgi:ATP-dependent Clp protease ATP-binding subunit ClpB
MNINKFTIKSQEAIQLSQQLAQVLVNNRNEHIFKAIFDVDENVAPFILKKLNVNVPLFLQILIVPSEFSQSYWWRNNAF